MAGTPIAGNMNQIDTSAINFFYWGLFTDTDQLKQRGD